MIDRRRIEQRSCCGLGWLAVVSEITGLARSTIGRGINDLDVAAPRGRVRRQGVCLAVYAIECSGRELWPGASSIVRSSAVLNSICDYFDQD
ncbi:MAG: hypothetical protein EOR00_18505 [Mesorhizobium sp.]|uniref:hypothetical protein n=2 Tax=Mesorhizobium sp. TaxID=1871066 RepID=UPI000FE71C43|nr:hypothetical protein [Mesorhizobium sp.]RWP16028.1 MAG: hypothetical protein EOR00_18505 [Mesorhizobium sp.]